MKGKKKEKKKWEKPEISVLDPDATAAGPTPGTKELKLKMVYYYS